MDGLVDRETHGGGSDRAIVAKRLKAALTGRNAEREPGQNLAEPIDADPDVVCLWHCLAIPQSHLLLQDESRADLLRPALVELALQLARQP